jgi:hypothetical protein
MRFLRFGLLICALSAPGFGQSPDIPKILERLDKLEKQNEELMAEIRSLRAQLAGAPAASVTGPPAAAPETVAAEKAPVEERLDVAETRISDLSQSKIETTQRIPVSLTGMVLFNAFHNSRLGGTLQGPVTAGLTPSPATSGASFRQTVLGLKFNGPNLVGGGKATGSIYMDFWGGTQVPSNNLFRIRLATLALTWSNTTIVAGQDKPIVSPREPTTLAQVGLAPLTGAGNLWNWNPQVRIEHVLHFGETTGLTAEAGVFQTTEVAAPSIPPAVAATLERARPAWQGRFNFFTGSENRRFEFAPGFHYATTHIAGQSVPSRLFTLDWQVRPSRYGALSGAFFNGSNAAGLGGLRQGFVVTPAGIAKSVDATGGWAQLQLDPTARLAFHFYAGVEDDRNSQLAANAVGRNLIWAGNAIYKLAPNILTALEFSQNRTSYIASGLRLNNHYDLALAYLF